MPNRNGTGVGNLFITCASWFLGVMWIQKVEVGGETQYSYVSVKGPSMIEMHKSDGISCPESRSFFFLYCSIYQWSVSKWCTRLVHCTFQIQMAHTQELNLQCFGICPKGCAIVHNTADYTGLLLQVNAVYGGYKKLCIRMRANGLQEFWIFSAHYIKGYIMVQIQ